MLSEDTKDILSRAFRNCSADAMQSMQERGPAALVEDAVEEAKDCARRYSTVPEVAALARNIESNRPEAERYMAGLLGMM